MPKRSNALAATGQGSAEATRRHVGYRPRCCLECGASFLPIRRDQEFCLPACRQSYHKRRYERGAQLYDRAMKFRGKREKVSFTKLCKLLDDWLFEDRMRRTKAAE